MHYAFAFKQAKKKNTNRKTKLFVCCLAISTHIVELNLDGLSLTNCLLLEEIKQKRSHTLWLIIIPGALLCICVMLGQNAFYMLVLFRLIW